jgi:hypothetical protein
MYKLLLLFCCLAVAFGAPIVTPKTTITTTRKLSTTTQLIVKSITRSSTTRSSTQSKSTAKSTTRTSTKTTSKPKETKAADAQNLTKLPCTTVTLSPKATWSANTRVEVSPENIVKVTSDGSLFLQAVLVNVPLYTPSRPGQAPKPMPPIPILTVSSSSQEILDSGLVNVPAFTPIPKDGISIQVTSDNVKMDWIQGVVLIRNQNCIAQLTAP